MAKQYPASKTQLRALASLGIQADEYITYPEAAKLLEKANWTADGRGPMTGRDDVAADLY